jgi:type II secretory pathway pseudopilin PulG
MGAALRARGSRVLRSEDGFGLIELTISMAMLAVALLALVAALSSGVVTLQRAGAAGTAGTLADRQMEKYRAIKYDSIMLDSTDLLTGPTPAKNDSVYTTDPGRDAGNPTSAWDQPNAVSGPCPFSPRPSWPDPCAPIQNLSGAQTPDKRSYRVDTYITNYTPTGGRQLKVITVVVRDANQPTGPNLARLQSRFDQATGE